MASLEDRTIGKQCDNVSFMSHLSCLKYTEIVSPRDRKTYFDNDKVYVLCDALNKHKFQRENKSKKIRKNYEKKFFFSRRRNKVENTTQTTEKWTLNFCRFSIALLSFNAVRAIFIVHLHFARQSASENMREQQKKLCMWISTAKHDLIWKHQMLSCYLSLNSQLFRSEWDLFKFIVRLHGSMFLVCIFWASLRAVMFLHFACSFESNVKLSIIYSEKREREKEKIFEIILRQFVKFFFIVEIFNLFWMEKKEKVFFSANFIFVLFA